MSAAARACHHHGVLVADVERAGEFYAGAFGARWLFRPAEMGGRAAAALMAGPPGTRFKMAMLGFEQGGLELFEFLGPTVPEWAAERRPAAPLPHLALEVEDLEAALARVREGGGSVVAPPQRFGAGSMVYAADPDGNVIELVDLPLAEVAAEVRRLFAGAEASA